MNMEESELEIAETADAAERERRERSLRAIVAADPRDVDAVTELAMICHETQRRHEAATLFERAVALAPRDAILRCNTGNALAATGRPEAALAHFREATLIDPRLAHAHFLTGNALRDLGRDREAAAAYGLAVGLDPRLAAAERELALLLRQQGDLDGAAAAYRRALSIEPDRAAVHFDLANLLSEQGHLEDAAASYRAALRLKPDFAGAACHLGHVFLAQRRFAEAESCYRRALAVDAKMVEAVRNLALVLEKQGKIAAAISAGETLVGLAETELPAWIALGRLYQRQGRPIQALGALRRALTLAPTDGEALLALMPVLDALERPEEAIAAGRRILGLDPDNAAAALLLLAYLRRACRWREAEALASRVERMTETALAAGQRPGQAPAQYLLGSMDATKLRRIAQAWSEAESGLMTRPAGAALRRRPVDRKPDHIPRVGYLVDAASPAAAMIAALAEAHDAEAVETFLFTHRTAERDEPAGGLGAAGERLVDLARMRPDPAAQRIADEAIDILVLEDAMPGSAAMAIAARRPAPLQIAWPGFPGSCGAGWIDYVLADRIAAPPQDAPHWSEAICRLPHSYRPLFAETAAPAPSADREAEGLPADRVVLAAFHRPDRIEPALFRLWMELLGAVPDAVLWLWAAERPMVGELKRQAVERGIDPRRLHFAQTQPRPYHRQRLALADIGLDTHPYSDAAATADALAANVPVVTLRGRHFAGRRSASLLSGLGLPELVVEDLEAYRRLVLALAQDPAMRTAMRQRIAQARATSPLADPTRFARDLEAAYRRIWRRYLTGQAPEAIDIAAAGNMPASPAEVPA
ncbi:hypothetical protein FRZ61_11610 [Hypericibacter adhaerens]|uniref:protein O-GlcNAc transferase n=1 Tax=Hypericibacter adhaerens TaxID=2602016 RepID=A0A5J6MUB0_9PROT|nr:tetratricopeptide repeat protein [Hypericibacter adhaerens]QEX21238.1 hypothetical protein FRZ61_11610 [Hypericibacter adhaerens]